jgi:hypothetical protein
VPVCSVFTRKMIFMCIFLSCDVLTHYINYFCALASRPSGFAAACGAMGREIESRHGIGW